MNKVLRIFKRLTTIIFLALFIYSGIILVEIWPWRTKNSLTNFMKTAGIQDLPAITKIEEISPLMMCSIIKSEDRFFFRHSGFDWIQIKKIIGRYIRTGQRLGGSTISQQLARNIFLDSKYSWFRKLREALITVLLELTLDKRRILEIYLNNIYYGENLWGITETSNQLFNKTPESLNLSESLFISSIIAAPNSEWSDKNLKRISIAYDRVGLQLLRSGIIEKIELQEANQRFEKFKLKLKENKNEALKILSEKSAFAIKPKIRFIDTSNGFNDLNECGLNQEFASSQLWDIQKYESKKTGHLDNTAITREVILSQSPNLINLSFDQKYVLYKRILPKNFELFVTEATTDKIVANIKSSFPFFATTWHPFERKIVFSRRTSLEKFEIVVWDIEKQQETIAETYNSERPPGIRWSPDGKFISYTLEPTPALPRSLRIISWPSLSANTVNQISRRGNFDWSPDSKSIAVVPLEDPGAIKIINLADQSSKIHAIVNGECFAAHWGINENAMLANCRKEGREYIDIYQLNLTTETVTELLSANNDLTYPIWHPNKTDMFFHSKTETGLKVILLNLTTKEQKEFSSDQGFNIITGFSEDAQSAFISSSKQDAPPQLIKVNFNNKDSKTIFSAPIIENFLAAPVKKQILTAADGLKFTAFHWPARKKANKAILFLHGGPDTQVMPNWSVINQYYAAQGYDVLAPNFRGSSGYGYSFEKQTGEHEKRIQDVWASWDYIVNVLKIPPERIILLGQSYGARLAADTLRENPKNFAAIVLVSPVPNPIQKYQKIPFSGPIIVYRGLLDVLPEKQVRTSVKNWFGSSAHWHYLKTEGHISASTEAIADTYGRIIDLID